MPPITLMRPTIFHQNLVQAYAQEFYQQGEMEIPGTMGLLEDSYPQWLSAVTDMTQPETVRPGFVVADTYLVFSKENQLLVGICNLRHRLNAFLSTYGGHIGYSVRPSQRGKGYATQMLAFTLDKAKALGLPRVLVTCGLDNLSSAYVIEQNGGRLEKEAVVDGQIIKRYWISL